jgi:cytochrome c553
MVPLITTVCAGLLAFAQGASASNTKAENVQAETASGDAEAGAKLYKKDCRGCHGPTAKGVSSYPKLRGQTAAYLADKLERYRKGEKFGPNTPLMAPRAKKLSDQDILDISTFIASLD